MSEEKDCASPHRVRRSENEHGLRRAESEYGAVSRDDHEGLKADETF